MNEQTKQDSPVLYTEDTQTPTNVNTTMQAPVTKGEDGVILDDYAAKDQTGKIDNTTYATTPNTTTSSETSATGSGLNAAEGTTYGWEKKASERANLDYQSAVLESKSNYLTNRQELESQGQQMQNQMAMQQYSQNQSSEKAGWTGGYILDTERQMAYLKQTIQSQMYGQMELQKYGYDTSLAAARLAYDTNKYDLALEYYNTALSRAVSEAEITGYYVSPETSEMLNEYSIASRIMNDETATEEDKQRADKVLASVYEWFEANGISKQGVETYSHLVEERTNKLSIESTLEYIDTANKQISADVFTKLDENGNPIFNKDNTSVETINFKTMTTEEIKNYINSNEKCKEQFYGYLDENITGKMVVNFEDYCIANKMMTKNEDNSYSPKEGVNYEEEMVKYLQSSSAFIALKEKLGFTEGENIDNEFQTLLENYDFDIVLPNGTMMTTTFQELNTKVIEQKNSLTNGTLKDLIRPKTDAEGNVINNPDGSKAYANNIDLEQRNVTIDGNTFETTYVKDANLYFTSLQINQDADQSEDDVTLSSGLGDKFNLELAENLSSTQKLNIETRDSLLELYEREFGKEMPDKTVIVYNDTMYVYRKQDTYNSSSKDYETKQGFIQLKGQCNDDTSKPAEFIKHLEKTWGSGE